MKTLEIKIKNRKESFKDVITTVEAIQCGKKVAPKKGIFYTSLDAARNLMTEKRLELLHIIKQKHPKTILDLAKFSGRDFKNVHEDIQILRKYGLVSLPRPSPKSQKKLSFQRMSTPYEAITIQASI